MTSPCDATSSTSVPVIFPKGTPPGYIPVQGPGGTTTFVDPATLAIILHGVGAPSDSIGVDGNYYLDTSSPGAFWGPKTGGTWAGSEHDFETGGGGGGMTEVDGSTHVDSDTPTGPITTISLTGFSPAEIPYGHASSGDLDQSADLKWSTGDQALLVDGFIDIPNSSAPGIQMGMSGDAGFVSIVETVIGGGSSLNIGDTGSFGVNTTVFGNTGAHGQTSGTLWKADDNAGGQWQAQVVANETTAALIVRNGAATKGLQIGVTSSGTVTIQINGSNTLSITPADIRMPNLPTSNPGAGTKRLWSNGGVVTLA
jgi:hypothetical protein